MEETFFIYSKPLGQLPLQRGKQHFYHKRKENNKNVKSQHTRYIDYGQIRYYFAQSGIS